MAQRKRRFDDPIPLPRGRQLVTLEDAGKYITRLPKAEHEAAAWQAAMEALILVATSLPGRLSGHRPARKTNPEGWQVARILTGGFRVPYPRHEGLVAVETFCSINS
jgi:hypothetical protein